MKLEKIIQIADAVYPDGLIQQAFDANKDHGVEDEPTSIGDSLAEFIARELTDTYNPKTSNQDQLLEASRVMGTAYRELGAIQSAFDQALCGK